MQNVKGKTAFITGGASGMGLGMARAFAEAGMKVVIADIRDGALADAMKVFENTNLAVTPIKLDVTDREGWKRAADEAERVYGNIHVAAADGDRHLWRPELTQAYPIGPHRSRV